MRRRGARTTFCVYYLLIISVRRPVFLEKVAIKYTKKRHDCIIDFHVNVFYFLMPLLFLLVGQGPYWIDYFVLSLMYRGAFPTGFLIPFGFANI